MTLEDLTPREREIARAIADGKPYDVIADALCISRRTVEAHANSISAKLKAAGVGARELQPYRRIERWTFTWQEILT